MIAANLYRLQHATLSCKVIHEQDNLKFTS
jgi:hypothetical protein